MTEEQKHVQRCIQGYKQAGAQFLADRLLTTIFSNLQDPGAVAVHNVFVTELCSMIDPADFPGVLEEIAGVVITRSRIFRDGPDPSITAK